MIVPVRSDCLTVREEGEVVSLTTETGDRFAFPFADVRLLPIVHSSAEELAAYLLDRLRTASGVPDEPDRAWVDDWLHRSYTSFWAQ